MAKKIDGYINLQVPAGIANPSPPIGPALGQRGVNIMDFCKAFETKTPPASYLIKKIAKLKKGSSEPGKTSGGTIKASQIKEIAETKMADLNANSIDQAMKIISGTARSMGVEVVEG